MSLQVLVNSLVNKGKNRFETPEETAKELQKISRSSFQLDKAMKVPVNLSLSVTHNVIQHMSLR